MAFEAITTQEEFDKAISERLNRERSTIEKKYGDYEQLKEKAGKYDAIVGKDYEGQIKSLNEQLKTAKETITGHNAIVADLTKRAETAETKLLKNKVAHEAGLPVELADRLTGDTEEALKEDAKTLAEFAKVSKTPPMRSTESQQTDNKDAALKGLLENLTGGAD